MKMKVRKIVSILLVLTLAFSALCVVSTAQIEPRETARSQFSYLTTSNINPEEISNAVVIPGIFQSRTLLYDEQGNVVKDADGKEYSAPFFLDTTKEIVSLALRKVLLPLLTTLIFQHDFGNRFTQSVSDVLGSVLGEKILSDSNGEFVYNVKADRYNGSVATLTQAEKDYIYNQIPLTDYSDIVGEDHLYFFSYESLGNINKLVDELYLLIQKAASESPTGKANIVPISQGGTLANNLLERYPQVGEILDRVIYIVPALDGSLILGEIFTEGIIDDDRALYDEVFPILLYDEDTPWMGYLVNTILRILPKRVVNDLLDRAVDSLIGYLKYSTCIWALVSQDHYQRAADKYLNGAEDQIIRTQTDAYWTAQKNSHTNIQKLIDNYGIKVFNVVDYNFALYPIIDSWDDVNADGVIHLSSTSMGAHSAPVGKQLPADYVPVKGEKYVDKHRIVDAGAGLLPDTTFYFHDQDHERTASNDVIMKLATCLLVDYSFNNVDSYPDKFPQFNECRNAKGLIRDLPHIAALKDKEGISAEDKAELEAAVNEMQAVIDNTIVDPEKFESAKNRLYAIRDKINGVDNTESFKDKLSKGASDAFGKGITGLSNALYKIIGGKGFSDIFRIF